VSKGDQPRVVLMSSQSDCPCSTMQGVDRVGEVHDSLPGGSAGMFGDNGLRNPVGIVAGGVLPTLYYVVRTAIVR
jgi:hypothetical protein